MEKIYLPLSKTHCIHPHSARPQSMKNNTDINTQTNIKGLLTTDVLPDSIPLIPASVSVSMPILLILTGISIEKITPEYVNFIHRYMSN